MEDRENCPLCGKEFPIEELISHAERCGAVSPPTSKKRDIHDADWELALKLQQEEEQSIKSDEDYAKSLMEIEQNSTKKSNGQVKCLQCSSLVDVDDLYILDECTHRFCKSCLQNYVTEMIQKSVALHCPLKECGKELSVRDLKDLLPKIQKSHENGNNKKKDPFNPQKGTGQATERIMSEFKHIMKSDPETNGYSVKPINDNLYKWELKLFNFDKSDPLGQDMIQFKVKNIVLHIMFPSNYPFSPPYIRVIKPRFQFRTGHVTIGGSICMEVLTNSGWSPANTIEAIIVSIRAQLIAGNARLDPHNKHEYTEQEAKEAFDRMVREHNWY